MTRGPVAIRTSDGPVSIETSVPGSKSATIRAIFMAGLAEGVSRLVRPLAAEDSAAARRVLSSLGAQLADDGDDLVVTGNGGVLDVVNDSIDLGESALTARLTLPLLLLTAEPVRVYGRGRLPQRPLLDGVQALQRCGAEVYLSGDGLPLEIRGSGRLPGGKLSVSTEISTQHASGLLISAPLADRATVLEVADPSGSLGYLDLTVEMMNRFGCPVSERVNGYEVNPGTYSAQIYQIPPDASSAVYPLVAAALTGGTATVSGLRKDSSHPDLGILEVLQQMGCEIGIDEDQITVSGADQLQPIDLDLSHMPDGAIATAIACSAAAGRSRLTGLHSLRHKESDRLTALKEILHQLGCEVDQSADSLEIFPGKLRSGTVDPRGDHRIAMSVALIGLIQPGIVIETPAVVAKTWPGFFEELETWADQTH